MKSNQFTDWAVSYDKNSSHPGNYSKHYRPDIPLVIIETTKNDLIRELIEKTIKHDYPNNTAQELKLKPDPFVFAREMYHQLRQLSKNPNTVGYVIKNNIPQQNQEAWLSIWDRLEKASSKTYHLD